MKSKCIFLILGFSQFVYASPKPLIQSEEISVTEYEAFLKTEPKFKSVIETLATQRANSSIAKELAENFEAAERSFLSDTVESAHENYKKVLALALASDWTESQRQLLFHSYLRAAQTAVLEAQRQNFLDASIAFDPKSEPDEKLFPPPLVAEWRAVKKAVRSTTLQLPPRLKQFEGAFINGTKVDFKRYAIRVPARVFRLTLLSNRFEPVTRVGTVNDMRDWEPKTIPLSSGTCASPQIHTQMLEDPSVLYSDSCISTTKALGTASKATEMAPALFQKTNFAKETQSQDSVLKKPLFWGIVGSVVAIAAYSASRQKNDEAPATHKTGF